MKEIKVTFRSEVSPADRESVRQLAASTGFFTDPEIEVALELVDERISKGDRSGYHFLFAEKGSQVVGYTCFGPIACTQASFDLYWIVVHAESRGQGIGRRLLAESEKAVREMGGERIYIETSSRAQYGPTRAFYLHCDYEEEAILEDFYAPGDSKLIYRKLLG